MSSRVHVLPLVASLHRLGRSLAQLPVRIHAAATLSRSRQHLLRLDDHLLRDIGLSRTDALSEAEKSVWDAPSHWQD